MKWSETTSTGEGGADAWPSSVDEIRSVVESITGDRLRVEFYESTSEAASLSVAFKKLFVSDLKSAGWKPVDLDAARPLPPSFDLLSDAVASRVCFHHRSSLLRNLLMPSLESQLAATGDPKYSRVETVVLVTATEEFRKLSGMNSAVATYHEYCAALAELRPWTTVDYLVVGLHAPAELHVSHEKNHLGRRRAFVERPED